MFGCEGEKGTFMEENRVQEFVEEVSAERPGKKKEDQRQVDGLYQDADPADIANLPARSTQSLAEPKIRTHGADRFSDEAYWSGHGLGIILIAIAIALIIFGRGPRRTDALAHLWDQKKGN